MRTVEEFGDGWLGWVFGGQGCCCVVSFVPFLAEVLVGVVGIGVRDA